MRHLILPVALLFVVGCSSSAPVNMQEPRRVVGTENDVRIDAQIFGDRLSSSSNIPLKYDITNNRDQVIAVADIIPETTYDPDTQTVTVSIGSEVPGETLLPRLIPIAPGEKKSFSTVARVNIMVNHSVTPSARFPNAMRVKVNFLDDTAHFQQLVAIPEKGVHNPQLADKLFPMWVERNETVYTNTVPMRWTVQAEVEAPPPTIGRRRRRG
jgi:uncharacterized protein YcfL